MGQVPSGHSMCPGVSWSWSVPFAWWSDMPVEAPHMSCPSGKWHRSWPWHTRTLRVVWGDLTWPTTSQHFSGEQTVNGIPLIYFQFRLWSSPIFVTDLCSRYRDLVTPNDKLRVCVCVCVCVATGSGQPPCHGQGSLFANIRLACSSDQQLHQPRRQQTSLHRCAGYFWIRELQGILTEKWRTGKEEWELEAKLQLRNLRERNRKLPSRD